MNATGSVAGVVSPYLIGFVKDTTAHTGLGMFALLIGAALVFADPGRLVDR